ncbi:MAG TPA: hypothetical protein VJ692_04125 [Nitrospiraceae bacterium]|nr:hypothetical protein [Nitrospiraceae bacterium]
MDNHHHRVRTKPWSRTALPLVMAWSALLWGCAEGVKLAQQTESGGIVTYPFAETGHLLSPFRREALQMIEKRCKGASRIVKEGEAKGRTRINENAGGAEEVRERRWGIQFECK